MRGRSLSREDRKSLYIKFFTVDFHGPKYYRVDKKQHLDTLQQSILRHLTEYDITLPAKADQINQLVYTRPNIIPTYH